MSTLKRSQNNKLYDPNAALQVIGSVFRKPSLLDEEGKYYFSELDFNTEYHRVVFGVISNLYKTGTNRITSIEIDDYLKERVRDKAIYDNGRGYSQLMEIAEKANVENFDYYYNRLKKFTLLRGYDDIGLDVSFLYDADNIIDIDKKKQQEDKFDSLTLNEIAQIIEEKIDFVKRQRVEDVTDEAQQIGDSIFDLLDELKAAPEVGSPLYGKYINGITRGARLGKFYIRSAPTGVGKAIPDKCSIPTPTGWKQVGEVEVGDYLFSQDGKPTEVLAVYPQEEKKAVWEVRFSDGTVAECCGEHLWEYWYDVSNSRKKKRVEDTKTIFKHAKELKNGFEKLDGSGYRFAVKRNKCVDYKPQYVHVDPYVMGVLLGCGKFKASALDRRAKLNTSSKEIADKVAIKLSERYGNVKAIDGLFDSWTFKCKSINYRNYSLKLSDLLGPQCDYFLALWNDEEDKFIPDVYIQNSYTVRMNVLKGLMDTCGDIDCMGNVTFSAKSKLLCSDVINLARSLGMCAKYVNDSKLKVIIRCSKEMKKAMFSTMSKLSYIDIFCDDDDIEYNYIIDIKKTDKKTNMTCFTVDNDSHLFLMNDFITTHNTRTMVADACYIACDEMFDSGEWKPIGCGIQQPTLYISTELDMQEIQTMALAFISGVNEEHILKNRYDFGEEDRVRRAATVLRRCPLYIETVPDFSLRDIENVIKRNIRVNATQYIFFDYLHTSMKILEEISRRSGGISLREDNILFLLSVKLKDICTQYGVFILTSTQLNGDWKKEPIPDQNMLRGAKSISDKADWCSILLDATDDDRQELIPLVSAIGCDMPNMKMSVYKNRRGEYNKFFLWMVADKGTCRYNPIFATDYQYNQVYIEDLAINVESGGEF